MTSEVSICNLALGWLGVDPITSLDEQGTAAELCNINFAPLRDAVLEERSWSFAIRREKSTTADLDEFSTQFKHTIDKDWLLVLRAYASPPYEHSRATGAQSAQGPLSQPQAQWEKVGETEIISPNSTLYLWGLRQVTDVTQFTEGFRQALAARLAADLAVPLTRNRQLQSDMWGLYARKLADAATRDGQQGRNELIGNSRLVGVRYGA